MCPHTAQVSSWTACGGWSTAPSPGQRQPLEVGGERHHPPQSEDFGRETGIAFRQQDRPDRSGRQCGQRVGPEARWHLLALQRDRARQLEEAVHRVALGLHSSTLRHGPAAHKDR